MNRFEERMFRQKVGYECGPLPLLVAAMVVSAASATVSVVGQQRAAKAQAQYQDNMQKSIDAAAYDQSYTERVAQSQEQEQRAHQLEQARQQADQTKASAYVAGSEAGMSGLSFDALMQDYQNSFSQYKTSLERQAELSKVNSDIRISSIVAQSRGQKTQVLSPIAQPNYAAAGLQVASSAMSSYAAYNPSAFKAS